MPEIVGLIEASLQAAARSPGPWPHSPCSVHSVVDQTGEVCVASAAGAALISQFRCLFGAFLVPTGVKMYRQRSEHIDPSANSVPCGARRLIQSTPDDHGKRF